MESPLNIQKEYVEFHSQSKGNARSFGLEAMKAYVGVDV
jgi:hypothetical protein